MKRFRLDRPRGFLAASALLIAVAVALSGFVVGRFFERQLLTFHGEQTASHVNDEARRHLTPTLFGLGPSPESAETFQSFLGELPGIFRIKVFDRGGRIIWSNERRLIGVAFPDNAYLARALAGEITTVLEEPKRSEHVYERARPWIAEAYVPITFGTGAGVVGVIETYRDVSDVVAGIRRTEIEIWAVAGTVGVALWCALAFVAQRSSAAERRAIARLESQNRELGAIQDFTKAILQPLDHAGLAETVVECAGAGLGLRRATLYQVGADNELSLLAHWSGSRRRGEPARKDAPIEAITTGRPVIKDATVAFPVTTRKGTLYLFVGELTAVVGASDLAVVRALEVMLQEVSVALSNVALFNETSEAREQLAAILAGVTDRMTIIDRRMRMVWTNDAAAARGREGRCYEATGGATEVCDGCPASLAFVTGQTARGRIIQHAASGRRYLDVVAAPLSDPAGYVQRVLEVARDITDLVELEERLRESSARMETANAALLVKTDELERKNEELVALQAELADKERLAAVGEVTVGLHHAILNPLAGVAGALDVLERGELPAGERAPVFAEIRAALGKIVEVVKRVGSLRRAAGTPYVGHTTMLDLERRDAGGGGQPARD